MNKIDKLLAITLIILPIIIAIPILAFLFTYKIAMTNPPNNVGHFVYFLFKLNCVLLPLCSLILFYTFCKKIIIKSKTFNSWLIIVLNLIFMIACFIISYVWIAEVLISNGINS